MPSIFCVAGVSLLASVSATARVHLLGSGDSEATATVELDGGAVALAQPTPGTVQEAGMEFYVGDVQIPPSELIGQYSVTRSRRQVMQGCNFSLRLSEWGVSWLGDPWQALGPPLGTRELNVYGVYRRDSDGKVYRKPLLLRGVVDNMQRDSSPDGGHYDTYECHDAAARYSRKAVTIIFPAGHGLPRPRMVQKILAQAGEARFQDPGDGRPGWMERQFVDAAPLESCQEILDLEGRILRWNRYGVPVCPKLWQPNAQSVATYDETGILAISSVHVGFTADVITEVTATGTEQLHSPDAPVCGEVAAAPVEVRTRSTFAVPHATYLQNVSGCTLTNLMLTVDVREQLESLVITRRITRCGILVREETETWTHYNPVAARYQQSGASKVCLACYVGADGTVNGSETAYLYDIARWSMVGFVVKRYFYDAPSYTGPQFFNADGAPDTWLMGNPLGSETGLYLGSISETFGFYNRLTAAKQITAPGQTFDTNAPINGVLFNGSGETVLGDYETFQRTQQVTEVVRANAVTGFQESVTEYTRGYAIDPRGNEFQFSNGALSDQQNEVELLLRTASTAYALGEENTHSEVNVTIELGKAPVTNAQTGVAGGPPAAEYLPGYGPEDPTQFLDAEDQTFGETARDGETRPIKVTVSVPELLATHLARAHKASFPYAEDLEDLTGAAQNIIVESLVVPVSLTVAANFLLSEGDVIRLTHRPAAIVDRLVVVDSISHQGSAEPGSRLVSQLGLNVYPATA